MATIQSTVGSVGQYAATYVSDFLPTTKEALSAPAEGGVGLSTLIMWAGVLSLLLAPGLLVTLPPTKCAKGCSCSDTAHPHGSILNNYRTSFLAILIHWVLFCLALTAVYYKILNKSDVQCVKKT